jgi:hypothetical protein
MLVKLLKEYDNKKGFKWGGNQLQQSDDSIFIKSPLEGDD